MDMWDFLYSYRIQYGKYGKVNYEYAILQLYIDNFITN